MIPVHSGSFTLLGRFAQQARERTDAVAIDSGDTQVTYAALAARVAAVARSLRAAGCEAGDVVATWVTDRAALVSAMLGAWSVGGVFAPLPTDGPEDRTRAQLDRLEPAFLLHDTDGEAAARRLGTAPTRGGRALRIPDGDIAPAGASIAEDTSSDGPAYIYFTSGSTGQPRGVVGSSRALAERIAWEIAELDVRPGARFSQLVTPTFDPWLRDVLVPLCAGGTICIPPERPSRLEPERLLAWLRDAGIELMHCGPTLLTALLGTPARIRRLPALRAVLCAGETLHVSVVARWRRRFGKHVRLVNLYGATEATMFQFFHVVTARDVQRAFIPVGRPLPGLSAHVIDAEGRPCPPGHVGEIVVGGRSLSLGYHRDPAATARAFANLGANGDDVRYRTGDVGVEFEPGTYRLLGRTDDQVKIRGVRVEPREVEDALTGYPLIASCAVAVHPDRHDEPSLVAYVVPETEHWPAAPEMRAYLRQRLPPEHVPAAFVMLKALPLSANGKVDRSRLPDPGDVPVGQSATSAPPGHPLEAALAEHWATILGLRAVDVHDHFLDLGGHSLTAMRLASAVHAAGLGELSLRDVFDHPTIAAQAALLKLRDQRPARVLTAAVPAPATAAEILEAAGPGRPATEPSFACPPGRSPLHGRRPCTLVMVLGREADRPSFERVADLVGTLDPSIRALVVNDAPGWETDVPPRPTLVFSPALLRHRPRIAARVCCGYPLAKSEEYHILERAGISVPRWITLEEGQTPDLSGFGDYVVRKPDHGAKGAEVRIVRRERVRWTPIVTSAAGPSPRLLVQEFVYTGLWPVSYRVNTLFGRVMYSMVIRGNAARPPLRAAADFGSGGSGVSIVSNARDSSAAFCEDAEIIRLGERAAQAFPELPMLGVDILKDATSGALHVTEVNALGHNWNFTPEFTEAFGLDVARQFDGLRKAAYVLAEETQRRA